MVKRVTDVSFKIHNKSDYYINEVCVISKYKKKNGKFHHEEKYCTSIPSGHYVTYNLPNRNGVDVIVNKTEIRCTALGINKY